MATRLILGVAIAAALAGCRSTRQKWDTEMLVNDAAKLVARDGSRAYVEFRTRGSRWFHDDTYVFVTNMSGRSLCHPARPDLEGQSLLTLQDADGKRIVREMIELLETQDAGWLDYRWPRPGEEEPADKSSYVVRAKVNGRDVMIGCGIYKDG